MNQFERNFKDKLLTTYKFISNYLDSHNLKWWASFGTVLGAVRHQGFIPWDDDIDIMMPREDYNKLLLLKEDIAKHGYQYVSVRNELGFYAPFTKIVMSNTTLWEYERDPFIIGVFVDIFPIDYVDNPHSVIPIYQKKLNRYRKSLYEYNSFHAFLKDLKGMHLKSILNTLWGMCISLSKRQKYRRDFIEYENSLYQSHGNFACIICEANVNGYCIFETSLFDSYEILPFEDTTVKVPYNFKLYLSSLYGDYMTPPPPEHQNSGHSHYYLNLKERLSVDQIKFRKKLENDVL